MPGPTKRKEKGQVLEKILENSSKPWYLQTPRQIDSENSSELLDKPTEFKPMADYRIISPKTRETESYRNNEGAYMAFKRPVVSELLLPERTDAVASNRTSKPHSKQPSIFELLEQAEEKISARERLNSHQTTERQSKKLSI